MEKIAKLLWYLTYLPMGFALAMTMCLGIGVVMLIVDLISLLNVNWTTEFPKGFWIFMYGCAVLRYFIGQKYDWDITNFKTK